MGSHFSAARGDEPFNITDFAWFPGGFATQAAELAADVAQPERWGDPGSEDPDDLSVLHYYLSNTARRLAEQDRIEYRTSERGVEVTAFNTGLFTSDYEPIFAYFERNEREDAQPWVLRGWVTLSDYRMRPFGDHEPEPASYFDEPAELLYDTRLPLNPRLDHIVHDNVDRYPAELQANEQLRRVALRGAIDEAVKRVQQSYKTAVPYWYWPSPARPGLLQLLLPLCLIDRSKTDLALVVEHTEHGYAGYTVLPLDAAYKRARLVARPDPEWLGVWLPEPAVEMPNDIAGVAYHSIARDDWRYKLADELHSIGVKVDYPI